MENGRRKRSPRGSEANALRDRSLAWWCSVDKRVERDRAGAGLESPKYRARRGLFPSSGETVLSPVHRGERTMRSRKRPRMSNIGFLLSKFRVPQSSVGFNGNSMVGCITGGVRGCALSATKTPGPLLSCRALSTRNGRPEDTSGESAGTSCSTLAQRGAQWTLPGQRDAHQEASQAQTAAQEKDRRQAQAVGKAAADPRTDEHSKRI
jgi:hypothetical protein